MTKSFRLDIERPTHGWVTVRLTLAEAVIKFVASYTPRDSIRDLASAANGLIAGLPEQIVIWNTEPVEYEFLFMTDCGRTTFEIWQFPDRRRQQGHSDKLVDFDGDSVVLARGIWRGLRRLQSELTVNEFEKSWGQPFPQEIVERLGRKLKT